MNKLRAHPKNKQNKKITKQKRLIFFFNYYILHESIICVYHTIQVLGFVEECVGGISFSGEGCRQHQGHHQKLHPYYRFQICFRVLGDLLCFFSQLSLQNFHPFFAVANPPLLDCLYSVAAEKQDHKPRQMRLSSVNSRAISKQNKVPVQERER